MDIKNSLLEQASFYEHTWEVVIYMVITGKRRSDLDIWPKTPNQDIGTKEMILKT